MKRTEETGCLSLLSMSEKEIENFLKYYRANKGNDLIDYLVYLLGTDEILEFFDVFSKKVIHCPSREWVMNTITMTQIYTYIESQKVIDEEVPDSIYRELSLKYNKRKTAIKQMYEKMRKELKPKNKEVVLSQSKTEGLRVDPDGQVWLFS